MLLCRIDLALGYISKVMNDQTDPAFEDQTELNTLIYSLCFYLILETKQSKVEYFEGLRILERLAERKELTRLNIFLGVNNRSQTGSP